MISIKQIKSLEEKIFKAVELIKALKQENKSFKSGIESANKKIEELEQIISDYRSTQSEIEEGIENALKQLDDLDSISAGNSVHLSNTRKEAEESSAPKNNSASLSEKEDLFEEENEKEEEIEEIKINYSKISPNRPMSNLESKKPLKPSVQNEHGKSDTTQLDIF